MFGFYRVATAVPRLRVADVPFNTGEIIALIKQGVASKASVLLFPELCITGYTCGDLFHQSYLLDKAEEWTRAMMTSGAASFAFSMTERIAARSILL